MLTTTLSRQTKRLTERVAYTGGRVDRGLNVVRGVKIIGTVSKNGREYPMETLRRAAHLYDGAKVNIDHVRKPGEMRSYADRFGHLESVHVRSTGLFGDLHYNPHHRDAQRFLHDAEHAPHRVGLSHNIEGATSSRAGKLIVEEIRQVVSVDIVADPAMTGGLFESEVFATIDSVIDLLDDLTPAQRRKYQPQVVSLCEQATELLANGAGMNAQQLHDAGVGWDEKSLGQIWRDFAQDDDEARFFSRLKTFIKAYRLHKETMKSDDSGDMEDSPDTTEAFARRLTGCTRSLPMTEARIQSARNFVRRLT